MGLFSNFSFWLLLLFSCSVMSNSVTQWTAAHQTVLRYLLEFTELCVILSQWCHPTILSSIFPFSSCPQFFPASESFPISQLFTSGGQSIGASASVLPVNIQGWFSSGLTGLIYLQSKRLSRVFSSTTMESINSVVLSLQIEGEKVEVVTDFLFLGSKITVGGDCSHEIKEC